MKSSYIELNCIVSGIERLNTQMQASYDFSINQTFRNRDLVILFICSSFIYSLSFTPCHLAFSPYYLPHIYKTEASAAISAIITYSTPFHSAPLVFTLVELHQRALKHWYDIQQNLKLIKKTEFWVVS